MEEKRAVLFLNGDRPGPKLLAEADFSDALTVCCDGAYDWAKELCAINVLAGDMDSVKSPIGAGTEVLRYSREKDYTDGLLGLKAAAEKGARRIDIYGAFGGRIDHEYYNYQLLAYADALGVRARLAGNTADVFYLSQNTVFTHKTVKDGIVSLAPFGDYAHILYTKGLKYAADDLILKRAHGLSDGFVMGVSNVATAEEITVALKGGSALAFFVK